MENIMKKFSLVWAVVVCVFTTGMAGSSTYKSSEKFSGLKKEIIWKAAMEVMKDYDLDVINKDEGYISTYVIKRNWPPGNFILFIKVYDDYFEVKADVVTGNRMFRGSYEEKEKEIIEKIAAKIHLNK